MFKKANSFGKKLRSKSKKQKDEEVKGETSAGSPFEGEIRDSLGIGCERMDYEMKLKTMREELRAKHNLQVEGMRKREASTLLRMNTKLARIAKQRDEFEAKLHLIQRKYEDLKNARAESSSTTGSSETATYGVRRSDDIFQGQAKEMEDSKTGCRVDENRSKTERDLEVLTVWAKNINVMIVEMRECLAEIKSSLLTMKVKFDQFWETCDTGKTQSFPEVSRRQNPEAVEGERKNTKGERQDGYKTLAQKPDANDNTGLDEDHEVPNEELKSELGRGKIKEDLFSPHKTTETDNSHGKYPDVANKTDTRDDKIGDVFEATRSVSELCETEIEKSLNKTKSDKIGKQENQPLQSYAELIGKTNAVQDEEKHFVKDKFSGSHFRKKRPEMPLAPRKTLHRQAKIIGSNNESENSALDKISIFSDGISLLDSPSQGLEYLKDQSGYPDVEERQELCWDHAGNDRINGICLDMLGLASEVARQLEVPLMCFLDRCKQLSRETIFNAQKSVHCCSVLQEKVGTRVTSSLESSGYKLTGREGVFAREHDGHQNGSCRDGSCTHCAHDYSVAESRECHERKTLRKANITVARRDEKYDRSKIKSSKTGEDRSFDWLLKDCAQTSFKCGCRGHCKGRSSEDLPDVMKHDKSKPIGRGMICSDHVHRHIVKSSATIANLRDLKPEELWS